MHMHVANISLLLSLLTLCVDNLVFIYVHCVGACVCVYVRACMCVCG